MSRLPFSRVLDKLHTNVRAPDATDARLMDLFIRQGDGQAFATLLHRHGPMVLGVCKRILGNVADAEDAFQATFLVLVRKARSLRTTATVGNWLYGVAHRTALEARRAMAKRRAKEAQAPPRAASPHADLDDLRAILDRELGRLPERYRQVVVLCDLEGQRRKDAARRLRCPEGTVASRLAKARSLLATRLARHGITLSAGALAIALAAETGSASVPPAWIPPTIQAARHLAAGTAGAGAVSHTVVSLVEGVCKAMYVKRLMTLAGVLCLLAMLGSGVGALYLQRAAAAEPDGKQPTPVAAQGKPPAQDEELRREIARLQEDLHRVAQRAAELEARLREVERDRPELLYGGKPATFWSRQLLDRNPKFRAEAVRALGGIAEVEHTLIPRIIATLRDKDHEVRDTASVALANVGEPAVPLLVKALKDPSQEHRNWVMFTLARFGPDARAAVPALTAMVKDGTTTDRLGAASVLGNVGPNAASAVPALMELLKDHAKMECYVAANSLGWIGPSAKPAVPLLVDLLRDPGTRKFPSDGSLIPLFPAGSVHLYETQAVAAEALGQMGPDAKEALPALWAASLNANVEPRVRDAIRRIDPAAAKKN
jgi:RNA polymerase sigma factor (sigma-70 family)